MRDRNPVEAVKTYFQKFNVPDYVGLPPFSGGAIGYLGYEAVQYFEDIPVKENTGGIPDGMLVFPETLLVYDTVKRSVVVVVSSDPGTDPESAYDVAVKKIDAVAALLREPFQFDNKRLQGRFDIDIESNMTRVDFTEKVERCRRSIQDGDAFRVVLSQKFKLKTGADPFGLYRSLRITNPSPYMFYLDFDRFTIIGSSPEVMVRLRKGEMLLKPIAGTRPRGSSVAEDSVNAEELLADEKERAEHLMLVDLGRGDLGRVAKPGSIDVADYMSIERYSHAMHIVSTIKAELDQGKDAFDVIRATFPAGALTGVPKVSAMKIISNVEPERRGPYGGMIFNLDYNGDLDSCIIIRSIVFEDGNASVQSGVGIVADSAPEAAYEETLQTARATVEAMQNGAEVS
jgi:anthranilate synthase component 1